MQESKVCFKCGEVKELGEFYAHPQMADGHLNKCKACTKADVHGNRDAKLDYYQKYDRERGRTEERKKRVREYAAAHPEIGNKAKKEWILRNPEKRKAHHVAWAARRRGVLVPQPCARCGQEETEMHHPDYSKPLEVEWLCVDCHAESKRKYA